MECIQGAPGHFRGFQFCTMPRPTLPPHSDRVRRTRFSVVRRNGSVIRRQGGSARSNDDRYFGAVDKFAKFKHVVNYGKMSARLRGREKNARPKRHHIDIGRTISSYLFQTAVCRPEGFWDENHVTRKPNNCRRMKPSRAIPGDFDSPCARLRELYGVDYYEAEVAFFPM